MSSESAKDRFISVVASHNPPRLKILQMRQGRKTRGAYQARIKPGIDFLDDRRDGGRTIRKPSQNRAFALPTMRRQAPDIADRISHRAAVSGPIDGFLSPSQLVQRSHIIRHRPIGRRDD